MSVVCRLEGRSLVSISEILMTCRMGSQQGFLSAREQSLRRHLPQQPLIRAANHVQEMEIEVSAAAASRCLVYIVDSIA